MDQFQGYDDSTEFVCSLELLLLQGRDFIHTFFSSSRTIY